MALPSPLPDNPQRWDGWRNYNSDNLYDRLCLDFAANPSRPQIEENCRQLLIWWQKKLPLKNQPSNPLAQLLRDGIDDAPHYLAEARTILLDPVRRAEIDRALHESIRRKALDEFGKFCEFAISGGVLNAEDESNLLRLGRTLGLGDAAAAEFIEAQLAAHGARRAADLPPVPAPAPAPAAAIGTGDPAAEFRRVLRLSNLDDSGMSDGQRDALCNIGEGLGLTGGQAEDLIDEYLEELEAKFLASLKSASHAGRRTVVAKAPAGAGAGKQIPAATAFGALAHAHEKAKYPDFSNSLAMEMRLVTSGVFMMGSDAKAAAPNEQPVSRVAVTCFYLARFPVTNAQYEQFEPAHCGKRLPGAGDDHPVVYVSADDAARFCAWLSAKERRHYRLPTEAEWEYAARGTDGRSYPWGERLDAGDLANFADAVTAFLWRAQDIRDGYAETSPVGAFPRGASAFGIEDMAGNVWEWCQDAYAPYTGRDGFNPGQKGGGGKRVYRGGSWKSRLTSVRATARGSNLPTFAANDVGFRIVCEC